MNVLLRLYRFLGSLSFTLVIFSFIILVVCVGTFLESLTQSHRFAEQWTYGHPLFFVVFLSLFANILFSATRRWPFQKRHIPFLITHLGLLLLLTGVWIKGAFGLQGHMNLLEGSGSHHVILPNQQMIRLTNRQGMTYDWHIAHTLFGTQARALQPRAEGPHITLIDTHPHGMQHFQLLDQEGNVGSESVYALEGGFGGYFLQVPQPSLEVTSSPEHLFQRACEEVDVDFATQWMTFLDAWQQSGRWLYPLKHPNSPQEEQLFAQIPWNELPQATLRAMQWSVLLIRELEDAYVQGKEPSQQLQEMGWPIAIKPGTAEEVFRALQDQLFQAASACALPPPPDQETRDPATSAALLSVLLRQPPSNPFLYRPIRPYVERLPSLTKREDETPVFRCRIAGQVAGQAAGHIQVQEEEVELVFDATEQGLKLPVLEGTYLAQCLPYSTQIPYHVRLRDTQKIVYPDSDQAASYEAECLITDRRTGEEEEVYLSMNRVHETADGHRFYLSSITPGHEESVRQVRLVVNRDPMRSLLTYLGGLFVAMGILLLARSTFSR